MSRFLFVVPPLAGHIHPNVVVARALAEAGHEVVWAAHADVARPLLPAGARLFDLGDARAAVRAFCAPGDGVPAVRGLESLQRLWTSLLVPLARAMRPAVAAAIAELAPDVVVVDQQAIGGALAARASGRPWATMCKTSAGVTDPLAGLPRVKAWFAAQLAALEAEAGLPATPAPDLSPARVIVLSTEAMVGPLAGFPAHFRFVGPALAGRRDDRPDVGDRAPGEFPWDRLARDRRRVLVSLGSASHARGGGFFATVRAALADGAWQVILVAPEGVLPDPPANFIVRPRVPRSALLPHVHAVICHGGHHTVCESLAHGVPLVVTPVRDDHPVIADQVERAGAGLRLRFGRLAPAALAEALERVAGEPGFAAAAARVRDSFVRAGGAAAAARALLELVPG